METLVVVAEHRSQGYSRVKPDGPNGARLGSSPSRQFREINCRTFQSSAGILPNPFNECASPTAKRTPPPCLSPKTPGFTAKSRQSSNSFSFDNVRCKAVPKCTSAPINIKVHHKKERTFSEDLMGVCNENLPSFSELWAGPAYSNSPPPSSLPIPKFSMRPKRTVSLDLPVTHSDVEVRPTAKSAPASPTRGHSLTGRDLFLNADSATQTLRRILNLDVADE